MHKLLALGSALLLVACASAEQKAAQKPERRWDVYTQSNPKHVHSLRMRGRTYLKCGLLRMGEEPYLAHERLSPVETFCFRSRVGQYLVI